MRSRLRGIKLAVPIVAIAMSACAESQPPSSGATSTNSDSSVNGGSFVVHDMIVEPTTDGFESWVPAQISGATHIASPLSSGYAPVAVVTSDAQSLVYSTWTLEDEFRSPSEEQFVAGEKVARPAISVLDLGSGLTTMLADGALGLAVSTDGRVAYVQGERPDYYASEPFIGSIVSRAVASDELVTLVADPGNYRTLSWAKDYLLYYVLQDGESVDLYRVKAGGKPALLAEGAGVVAISPDQDRVLIQRLGVAEAEVAILDIETGDELAHVSDLIGPDGKTVGALVPRGDWVGNQVVIASAAFSGLVYVDIAGDKLAVTRVVDIGRETLPWGLSTPRFTDSGVTAVAIIPPKDDSSSDAAYITNVVTCPSDEAPCSLLPLLEGVSGEAYPILDLS